MRFVLSRNKQTVENINKGNVKFVLEFWCKFDLISAHNIMGYE